MTKNELPTCSCGTLATYLTPEPKCIECAWSERQTPAEARENARIARAEQKMGR